MFGKKPAKSSELNSGVHLSYKYEAGTSEDDVREGFHYSYIYMDIKNASETKERQFIDALRNPPSGMEISEEKKNGQTTYKILVNRKVDENPDNPGNTICQTLNLIKMNWKDKIILSDDFQSELNIGLLGRIEIYNTYHEITGLDIINIDGASISDLKKIFSHAIKQVENGGCPALAVHFAEFLNSEQINFAEFDEKIKLIKDLTAKIKAMTKDSNYNKDNLNARAKLKVLNAAINYLNGDLSVDGLRDCLSNNPGWDKATGTSKVKLIVEDALNLKGDSMVSKTLRK